MKRVILSSATLLLAIAPVCAQLRTQPGSTAQPGASQPSLPRATLPAESRIAYQFSTDSGRQETSWVSGAESHFLTVETPFISDVTFQVATLAHGHVELGGFHRMSANENFYLGLPGGGASPAWTVTLASHPALWSRAAVESGGFTLAFHAHSCRGSEPAVQMLRRLSRLAESAYRN
ncbi:MAG TPA: hypothetical protein VFO34_10220 [Candidatus Acidoferrales bacterium]|nr:hypothetical protein [Candidatus Acidoferrales bacterium]